MTASPPPSEAPRPPAPEEDLRTIEQKQNEAKAQALLLGLGSAAKRGRRKSGCTLYVYLFVFLGLAGWAAILWFDKPALAEYVPLATPPTSRTYIGNGEGIALPAGWTSVTRNRFRHTSGAELRITHSSVMGLQMAPRTIQGRAIPNQYTAIAYGQSLRHRMHSQNPKTCYITLGKRKGVEASLESQKQGMIRGFVLVDQRMQAIELLFTLPTGKDSPLWMDAETILRSLGLAPAPKRAAPRQKTKKAEPPVQESNSR